MNSARPHDILSDVALIIAVMQCLVGVGYVFEFTSIGAHINDGGFRHGGDDDDQMSIET